MRSMLHWPQVDLKVTSGACVAGAGKPHVSHEGTVRSNAQCLSPVLITSDDACQLLSIARRILM